MGSGRDRIFCDSVVRSMDDHSAEIPDRDGNRLCLPALCGEDGSGFSCGCSLCAPGDLSGAPGIFLCGSRTGLHVLFYGAADPVLAIRSDRIAEMDDRVASLVPAMGKCSRRICGGHWADGFVLHRDDATRGAVWPSAARSPGDAA